MSLTILIIVLAAAFSPALSRTNPALSGIAATTEMFLPECSEHTRHNRRLGWRLQFDVPTREVQILGGKPDVDYVRYVIKPKTGAGYLELWFGPYAFNSRPDEDTLQHSASFQQRDVINANGGVMGLDSRVKLQSGELWRRTGVIGSGAVYQSPPENAALFDRIIDSACYVSPAG